MALLAAGVATAAAPAGSVAVRQAPPSPVVELLSRGTTTKRFDAERAGIELEADRKIDVAVARITFPTGSTSGWHTHPGPLTVTVTKGAFTYVNEDCNRHRYVAGQTFAESGRMVARLNNWKGKPGEVVVTFFAPVGADPLTIPKPAPACAGR
jgi:quercetin dioxygenase-like cupin family protein